MKKIPASWNLDKNYVSIRSNSVIFLLTNAQINSDRNITSVSVEVKHDVNERACLMHMHPWRAWEKICWCEKSPAVWRTSWLLRIASHHNSFNCEFQKDATTRTVCVLHFCQMIIKGIRCFAKVTIPKKTTTNKPTKQGNVVSVPIMSWGCPGPLRSHSDADGTRWPLHHFIFSCINVSATANLLNSWLFLNVHISRMFRLTHSCLH